MNTNANKPMTQREFLTKVKEVVTDQELIDFATNAIEKLDATNAKRKTQVSAKTLKTNKDTAEWAETVPVGTVLTAGGDFANIVIGGEQVQSPQKATHVLKKGVELGYFISEDVRVPSKGNVKSYTRIEKVDTDTDTENA